MKDKTSLPIDAVITWVDGADPKHKEKIARYSKTPKFVATKEFDKRFTNVEEVKYVVHSILKYAPFVRKIFIVTDEQTPAFLLNNDKYSSVELVDHKTIFKGQEDCLPVFNSRSIETKLYAIPDLAEHFIYFNDDMFLLNPTTAEDFFVEGLPVVRGRWHAFKEDIFYKRFFRKKKKQSPSHIIAQEKSAKILGLKRYFRFHHHPHPMRKSMIATFFKNHPKIEVENIQHRFRHRNQFLIQGLSYHLTLATIKDGQQKNYQLIHLNPYNKPLFWINYKLNVLGRSKSTLFLNLQNIEQCPEEKKQWILSWFEQKYALHFQP